MGQYWTLNLKYWTWTSINWQGRQIKCMTKMKNFAGSRKVAHILKVWSLLSTKIPISSRSVENSSVMSHSPKKFHFNSSNFQQISTLEPNLAIKFHKFCAVILVVESTTNNVSKTLSWIKIHPLDLKISSIEYQKTCEIEYLSNRVGRNPIFYYLWECL